MDDQSSNSSEGGENEEQLEEEVGVEEEEDTIGRGDDTLMLPHFYRELHCVCVPGQPPAFIDFVLVDIALRASAEHGTLVQLFGRASDGQSVCAILHGWCPYFYIRAPCGWVDSKANQDGLRVPLNEALEFALEMDAENSGYLRRILRHSPGKEAIVGIESVVGTSIMGFDAAEQDQVYLKLRVVAPALVRTLRDVVEHCRLVGPAEVRARCEGVETPTFNSNLDPVLQFMVDRGLGGGQWCRVPFALHGERHTRCDLEVGCGAEQLELLSIEERSELGPLRVLSFDLEAAGRRGVFPDPAIDSVIQIALHFQCAPPLVPPLLLSFKECREIPGARVVSFESEAELLLAFRDAVLAFDADVVTGYNICNFDLEYLQKRAEALEIGPEFCLMTRLRPPLKATRGPEFMNVREVFFQSAQVGKRKSNKVALCGRVVLDVYLWMLNNFKLDEYRLDSVCRAFLPAGVTKEDLHFTEITPKWQAGPEGRRELGVYCLKDAELPLALIDALSILFNAVERGRVIGIPMEYVLNRGNLVRFTTQLMRETAAHGYLLPHIPESSPLRHDLSKYTGATVLPVIKGIWPCVTVADFSSMYPSIIIAHNLCYSTQCAPGVRGAQCFQKHAFVGAQDRKGVIPLILERMLRQRKLAKEAYQAESDPIKRIVLKARENSIKVLNNGIYGAMGCRNALVPGRAIAETTTGIGRRDIFRVKAIAESLFTTANGYPSEAVVVGGDTDSVFVKMPTRAAHGTMEAIQEAMDMGHLLAATVNAEMTPPKCIAYQEVFENLLLMKKKRYAGKTYEKIDDKPNVVIKGIECVRRDGSPLIRNSILAIAQHIVNTGDVDGAAALVRAVVTRIMQVQPMALPWPRHGLAKALPWRSHGLAKASPWRSHGLA
jgi:DNA polymerase delta subunit 1